MKGHEISMLLLVALALAGSAAGCNGGNGEEDGDAGDDAQVDDGGGDEARPDGVDGADTPDLQADDTVTEDAAESDSIDDTPADDVQEEEVPVDPSILPEDRRTIWDPGIPGGIPARTTVCATLDASTFGNGADDATAGIQAAIDACPEGQVVQLSAGGFMTTEAIFINKGVVLRGSGPGTDNDGAGGTRILRDGLDASPNFWMGARWVPMTDSTDLASDAVKGVYSVDVASAAGLSAGQIVLIDKLSDPSYQVWSTSSPPGDPSRGWFCRYDRPISQLMEIDHVSGSTVFFTTPFHITFDVAFSAQLTGWEQPFVSHAGLEDMYVYGGGGLGAQGQNNIRLENCAYCWVKNIQSNYSDGKAVAFDSCFRSVLRDSYIHDTDWPYPGGAGYGIALSSGTADCLVENNISVRFNKVMVMQASGGGNVIAYNYMDDGFIENNLSWVETGINASHMTAPHFELFEGNMSHNYDCDDTWGNSVWITALRNHLVSHRHGWFTGWFPDEGPRRAIGLMTGAYYHSFIGNVLGYEGQDNTGVLEENLTGDPPFATTESMWMLGWNPVDLYGPSDPRVAETAYRHGNFDYVSTEVRWDSDNPIRTIPPSLYLTAKPDFFGAETWPWVDPTGGTKTYTLPAKARFDAMNP